MQPSDDSDEEISRAEEQMEKYEGRLGQRSGEKGEEAVELASGGETVSLSQAIAGVIDQGLKNKEWVSDQVGKWKADQDRFARSLNMLLQEQAGETMRHRMVEMGEKYAKLSRATEVTLRDFAEQPMVERGAALFHVGLARLWNRPEYEQAWDITSMQVAIKAMMSWRDSCCLSDMEFRSQVIVDPAIPEAIAERGKDGFSPMWQKMLLPQVRAADAVSVPIMVKTRNIKGIGHWISATVKRSGHVQVTDWLHGADHNPRERVQKFICLLLDELRHLWELRSKWQYTGNTRAQTTQQQDVTCGPRCLLGLLCQHVKGGTTVQLERWQYDIAAFQDVVMQRVDSIVVGSEVQGDEPRYDHGALVQEGKKRPTSIRSGSSGDAIMITNEGEVDYDEEGDARVEVERRHSQVEESGVDESTHARRGCRVERGRNPK